MLPTVRRQVGNLSRQCTDPARAETKMMEAINASQRKSLAILRRNFLQKTQARGMGTVDAIKMASNLTQASATMGKDGVNKGILFKIMKIKVEDAEKHLKIVSRQQQKAHQCLRDHLPRGSSRQVAFFDLLSSSTTSTWDKEKERLEKKLTHMTAKQASRTPEIIEGVKVGDAALGPSPDPPNPLIWGGDEVKTKITPSMTTVLNMPPKTTKHEQVDILEVETNVEIMLTKMRWEQKEMKELRQDLEDGDHRTQEERMLDKSTYNPVTGTLDFSKLRTRDLKTKRDVIVPKEGTQEEEEKMSSLKTEIMNITKEYIKDKCTPSGAPLEAPFPREAEKGIKDLQKLCEEQDLVVYETDKSGRLTINKRENYNHTMEQHTCNDREVTRQEAHLMERTLNNHTLQVARALGVGAGCTDSQAARLKAALINQDKEPPVLYGTPKDHKPVAPGDEDKGPPARPICGARKAPNGQLSDLLSRLLDPMCDMEAEERGSECRSTEDMLSSLEDLNQELAQEMEDTNSDCSKEEIIVGSMDVKSLYPSIDIEEATQTVKRLVTKYYHTMENINAKEAARYLALALTEDRVEKLGLEEILPARKTNRGPRPGISSPEVMFTALNQEVLDAESRLGPPAREPTEAEEIVIVATMVAEAVRTAMTNHLYQINGKWHVQSKGGPMGNSLTGVLARAVMLEWDGELQVLISGSRIDRLQDKRYVDDQVGVYRALPPGAQWCPVTQDVVILNAEEDTREPDRCTMETVRSAANTISRHIVMTCDYPTNNPSGKMPVLDIQCWIEGGEVKYEHYRKPMASKYTLLEESALPARVKRTTTTPRRWFEP